MRFLATVALALTLGACTTTNGVTKFDAAKFASVSRTALTGLENAASAYMASAPDLPPAARANIAAAEAAAAGLVASLPTAAPENAPQVVSDVIASLNAIMADLPSGAVPAKVAGTVAAVEIVAQLVVNVALPPPTVSARN